MAEGGVGVGGGGGEPRRPGKNKGAGNSQRRDDGDEGDKGDDSWSGEHKDEVVCVDDEEMGDQERAFVRCDRSLKEVLAGR